VNADRLRDALDLHARDWVRDIRVFDCVASTNDILKRAAREGAPEGTVALAAVQTAGRGRHGRVWVSPPGNLFLSILVRPADPALLTLLPLAAGVAVAEALESCGASSRLKWPNDVLAGGRKLAGILAEATSESGRLDAVVIGIGANVNVAREALPEDLRETATSLRDESGRAQPMEQVAAAVLSRWAVCYHALQIDRRGVRDAWRALSIDWWGRPIELLSGDRRIAGVPRDIDETGALVIETPDGARVAMLSGEARELRPTPPDAAPRP
jgi:BirA family transcriptional regulator, biotin operon repressor / biotin---[acetyl-CoA-carboxylase] ligase